MSDRFQPISSADLYRWVFAELEGRDSLFGIPRALFFRPGPGDRFTQRVYGSLLETPIGVAAGPHTQMAQNIVVAWLCGARFIELKTVQTLDHLDVPKPCIDMQDEGYNVEWSQELTLDQSFAEYLRAWVLIHALHRRLGFPGEAPGVVFNMSVGYDLAGILKPNVQSFLRRMQDAGEALGREVEALARHMPEARALAVPGRLSNNVTLSTMHGCPPGEIGKIARYLIEEQGLHTSVKLNPTLLGPVEVRRILNDRLGYRDVVVPDLAFEHDLKYPDAVQLVRELAQVAAASGVTFGVKLSNTLEVENHRPSFTPSEKMAYLSGRPLHAITVNLAARLMDDLDGGLMFSFAGGADAFNVARLLACGMTTVTTCSDLLRPGSYTRLLQYLQNAARALRDAGAASLGDFCRRAAAQRAGGAAPEDARACARLNLRRYADEVLDDPLLRKDRFERAHTKTPRTLGLFDCIQAPCTDACPVSQQVPLYMRGVREGRLDEAAAIVRADNPLGAILGRACPHPCEPVCTRTHYDEPLAIREIKRFIMDHEREAAPRRAERLRDARVAVIGAGPCGLGVAWFLGEAGYPVTVFEARPHEGGMVAGSIPGYRAPQRVIAQDLDRIAALGAEIRRGQQAGRDFTLASLRRDGFRYIVVAAGAQRGQRLGIAGEDTPGVLDALDFLRAAREGGLVPLGKRVGVVGGGDVAMDCARTAWRLGADEVAILYRRTVEQMPAQREELHALRAEGIAIRELLSPKRIVARDGRLAAARCARMRLGEPDESGRRRPVEVPGAEEEIALDTLIVAISQRADLGLFGDEQPALTRQGFVKVDPATLRTSLPGVYAGGDVVMEGPATIVKALGDAKRIAHDIRAREEGWAPPREEARGGDLAQLPSPQAHPREAAPEGELSQLLSHRARREFRVPLPEAPPRGRRDFHEVLATLSPEAATHEAARCLDCDVLCSQCVAACPNLAFMTYRQEPLALQAPELEKRGGRLVPKATAPFRVEQRFQVAVLTDFCNECGNCTTFCPTSGHPYRDKPRLYLDRREFEEQADNAFHLFRDERGAWGVQARWGGHTHEIVLDDALRYRAPGVAVTLDPGSFAMREAQVAAEVPEGAALTLAPCAAMYALLRGVRDSLPHLPAAAAEDRGEVR